MKAVRQKSTLKLVKCRLFLWKHLWHERCRKLSNCCWTITAKKATGAYGKSSERLALSDRAAAEIALGVLLDYGIITSKDYSEVTDRSKLRRERQKVCDALRAESVNSLVTLCGLYFDGRKDKTLRQEEAGGKLHRRSVVEEHVSLIQEPGSIYLGHVTPVGGSADYVKRSILISLKQNTCMCKTWQR